MYHMEKHGSLDAPPDIGLGKDDRSNEPESPDTRKSSGGISPSKRVNLRTESIKQLLEWHSLLEKGGINKEQYDEMQQAILKDIKDNLV